MAIYAKSGATFVPAPAGPHSAVCVDVVDMGMVKTNYQGGPPKEQHKIKLVWQIDCRRDSDGAPFQVMAWYTCSLHEKAKLRKHLESWRGRPFTPEQLAGFDLETLIGAPCQLGLIHREKSGSTYANVETIMGLRRGDTALKPDGYVRVCNRPVAGTGGQASTSAPPDDPEGDPGISDDDVPF
jgi:hypothetical protein